MSFKDLMTYKRILIRHIYTSVISWCTWTRTLALWHWKTREMCGRYTLSTALISWSHGGVQSRFNHFYGSMAFGLVQLAAVDSKWREVPEQVGRAAHKGAVLAPVVVSAMSRTRLLGAASMEQFNWLYTVTCVSSHTVGMSHHTLHLVLMCMPLPERMRDNTSYMMLLYCVLQKRIPWCVCAAWCEHECACQCAFLWWC